MTDPYVLVYVLTGINLVLIAGITAMRSHYETRIAALEATVRKLRTGLVCPCADMRAAAAMATEALAEVRVLRVAFAELVLRAEAARASEPPA
jgi:hypothetical protein